MPLATGTRLGPYEIVSLIGAGGMGEVYRAEDVRLGRQVALKLLPPAHAGDADALERFRREARVASSLNHPHICTLYDVGEHDGQQFMVMELLDGRMLKDVIASGPMPFDHALTLAIQITDALDTAHAKGIIHRDIKPANVFVTTHGEAKVLDFGIAKLTLTGGQGRDVTRVVNEHNTGVGITLGTLAYMSPEQARGDVIDSRTDLFSCGVVFYEMTTGTLPFPGATPVAVLESLLTRAPAAPSSISASIPADFDRIVAKTLEKDRTLRYQSAADLRADLKRLQQGPATGQPVAATVPPEVRKARVRTRPRARWGVIAGATAALAAIGVGAFFYASRTRAFSERDPVVIADFTNTTGEPVFDDTLKEALDVQLRQSPYLGVLPEQRIQGTLKLMGHKPGDKVTREVARDLCQRTASKAMIGGTISQLGSIYVISLDATNCRTGDTIEKAQVQAARKDEVLKALGEAAGRLRRSLGESLGSIDRYDAPIQDATTGSLDALKSYSAGMATRRRDGDAASMPFFRKAIEQDPNFALAHARLSTVYGNLGEQLAAREEIVKANAMRDRASEPERLYITARYATIVEGSIQKTIDTYEIWTHTYPNDFVPHSNLAGAYEQRGDHEKAIEEYRIAIRLAPDEPLPYGNLAGIYQTLGRSDEARRTLEDAIARGVDSIGLRSLLYVIAFIRHDEPDMARHLAAAQRMTEGFRMLGTQALVATYVGRLGRARELCEQLTAQAASRTGMKGAAAQVWSDLAQAAAALGDAGAARAAVKRSLELNRNVGTLLGSAFALVIARDVGEAQRRFAEAEKEPGADTDDAQRAFKQVGLLIRWRQGDRTSVDALLPPKDDNDFLALFINGIVNLDFGRPELAAAHFKRVVDNPTQALTVLKAIAPLYYGRALAASNRIDDSRKAYDQFFALFASADPGLPILATAKAEYARLKTAE